MRWMIRRSPFASHEDAELHMVGLLAKEAERAGIPLTDTERSILANESRLENTLSEEFRAKTTKLIEMAFDHEVDIDDPKNLGNSLQWAGDVGYPNVAALTEEVIRSRGEGPPQLH